MKQKSNAPLILGIIAAVLLVPGMFCVACAAGVVDVASGGSGDDGILIGYVVSIAAIVCVIAGAIFGKSKPTVAGILLLVATILALVGLILSVFTSVFHWAALILLIIACVFAFLNRKRS